VLAAVVASRSNPERADDPARDRNATLCGTEVSAMSGPTSDARPSTASPASSRPLDDRAILARVLDGDEAAFAALVERHHASILRLVGAFGYEGRAADEVARACWSLVLDVLETFRFTAPLKAWILRTAARAMGCGVDAVHVRRDRSAASAEPEAFDWAGAWVDPPVRWDEAVVAARATAAVLAEAMTTLPWRERAAVILRDVETLGVEDAAWVLDVGAGELLSLLRRARGELRRQLDASLRAPLRERSEKVA
jgi:RNA polymerase sigma-70 factor (ECF subfamily)